MAPDPVKVSPRRCALAAGLLACTALAVWHRDRFDAAGLQSWIESAGAAAPVVFVIAYAIATVLLLPGAVITLAGGALFGPVWGTLWNLTGATLGAVLSFLIARCIGAQWVPRHAGARLQQLNAGVSAEGWRFIAVVRLVPLFPFNLLNYALGLTHLPLRTYALASAVFMLPGAAAYTWLGYAGREALAGNEGTVRNLIVALALLSSVLLLPGIVRRLRRKDPISIDTLRKQLDGPGDVAIIDVRGETEFNGVSGHLAGSLNVPLSQLPGRLTELEPLKTRAIRLICLTDRRSRTAAEILANAGFMDARVVEGGMTAWLARGWSVQHTPVNSRAQ